MNKQKKLAKQNTPLYKRVPTLNLVDYSDIKVPLVVIYDSPKDFPGKVVARVWDGLPAAWTYKTDIPCEHFDIWEDGEIYCVGLVFSIEDLK